MISNRKVVAFTPAGRQRYMEILKRYVERDHKKGVVDEWILFNNAYTGPDDQYVRGLANDWIKVIESPGHRDHLHIGSFYKQLTDASAVYVRLDDDICYLDPMSIENLVRFRLARPQPFLVYGNTYNNTRLGFYQQREGKTPAVFEIHDQIFDDTAYRSQQYVEALHRMLLEKLRQPNSLEALKIPDMYIDTFERGHISVNYFAMLGEDMAQVELVAGTDEERWLSVHRPEQLGRTNAICGDAIAVHFAYHTQTKWMEDSGMLEDYKNLSLSL